MTNPPNNKSAEYGVLGAILFHNPNLYRVQNLLTADDFYEPECARLYARASEVILSGKVADGVTLADDFPFEWLGEVLDHAPAGSEAEDYAREIADCALRRGLIGASHDLQASAHAGKGGDALEAHEIALEAMRDKVSGQIPVSSAADRPEDIFAESSTAVLVRTGIPSLDHGMRGFERGTLNIIAARPGVGKSAIAIAIGANMAAEESVGFISCDMKGDEVQRRIACYLSWKRGKWTPNVADLKEPGRINGEIRQDLMDSLALPAARNFLVNDKHGQTVSDVNAQIRAWKRHCIRKGLPPLGAVFVDHIAKIAPRQRWSGLYEKTSFACNELLDVAKQHPGLVIIALCQLNRKTEETNRRPLISDLRDSGKIEEDATAILLLHREDHHWEDQAENELLDSETRAKAQKELLRCKGMFEVIIGKNRNDRKRTVLLRHTIGQNVIRDPNAQAGREVA